VCGFEVIHRDRVLTGRVEETEAGIQKYEEAVAAGDGAFMVEQERPDVFTARGGEFEAGAGGGGAADDGWGRWRLPTGPFASHFRRRWRRAMRALW